MNDNQAAPELAVPPNLPEPPLRVLMVEDDVSLRQLNSEVLARSGYTVDAARDAADAWKALQSNRYNLLITENELPDLTGIELLKKLRSARMALPVIVATSSMPEEAFATCSWIQPAALLPKPYAIAELLGAVSNVLCPASTVGEQAAASPNWPD